MEATPEKNCPLNGAHINIESWFTSTAVQGQDYACSLQLRVVVRGMHLSRRAALICGSRVTRQLCDGVI